MCNGRINDLYIVLTIHGNVTVCRVYNTLIHRNHTVIKKDSGVAMKEEKYVDDHASKVIHSNKPLTSGASQGRYKRLWGSG